MATINLSLPESMKSFVDRQVTTRGYETSGDYMRDLIRRDEDRQRLREALLEGAASEPGPPADAAYLAGLRSRIDEGR